MEATTGAMCSMQITPFNTYNLITKDPRKNTALV